MPDVHVLRVFTGPAASHGNLLAVFLEGAGVPVAERQRTAAAIGFSETVFVEVASARCCASSPTARGIGARRNARR